MSPNTLEEMINAVVKQRLDAIFETAMTGDRYRSVEECMRARIAELTKEEFKRREPEIRQRIAEMVNNSAFSSMELTVYTKLKGDTKEKE